MLEVGKRFPDFALPNQEGTTISLKDFGGKWLVIYIYPKDDTPGCTHQARSFTASKAEFDAAGVSVVGVSQDDVASHKDFCRKFSFAIDLLADPGTELIRSLGIPHAKYNGARYWERTTFVLDPLGVVRKVYPKVDPQGHERILLDDIRVMKAV
jgi:thioredoxin-dependent peroxiredoxin